MNTTVRIFLLLRLLYNQLTNCFLADANASRVASAQNVVTPAAYLLFYRRRSPTKVLGGPFFEDLYSSIKDQPATVSSPDEPSTSDNDATTAESPSGEGRRPGDSSRNGLSGALAGVGAVHQAGAGGVHARHGMATGELEMVDNDNEALPTYEASMRMGDHSLRSAQAPAWNFDSVGEGEREYDEDDEQAFNVVTAQPPPGHLQDVEDEDLFEGESTKALSSNGGSVEGLGSRMRDFDDDEEMFQTEGLQRFGTPVDGREPGFYAEADDSPPVLVQGGQRFSRMPGLSGYNSEVEDEGEVVEVKLSDEEERGRSAE